MDNLKKGTIISKFKKYVQEVCKLYIVIAKRPKCNKKKGKSRYLEVNENMRLNAATGLAAHITHKHIHTQAKIDDKYIHETRV